MLNSEVNSTDDNQLGFNKLFDQEVVRINLLLFALYLTAYETLKSAIIDNISDFFVWETRTEADVEKSKRDFEKHLSEIGLDSQQKSVALDQMFGTQQTYEGQRTKYEEIVGSEFGLKFDKRDRQGLIPSCKYLQDSGILTEADVEDIKKIREHRNRIAHGLPKLLTSKGFGVDLDNLQRIRELIVKVEMFWERFHISIEHPEIYEIPDESIFSGRVFLMDQILKAVTEYLKAVGEAG